MLCGPWGSETSSQRLSLSQVLTASNWLFKLLFSPSVTNPSFKHMYDKKKHIVLFSTQLKLSHNSINKTNKSLPSAEKNGLLTHIAPGQNPEKNHKEQVTLDFRKQEATGN